MIEIRLLIRGVKLLIGLEEVQKLGEIAIKAHLLDDVFHFPANAPDFAQTQRVHRVRVGFQAGVVAQRLIVSLSASWQAREPHTRAACRTIGVSRKTPQIRDRQD